MGEIHVPRVAILASGGGTTAEAFIRATHYGTVEAEVGLVICSNPPAKAGIYNRVDRLNKQYGLDIETLQINGQTHPFGKQERGQTLGESYAICDELFQGGYDHVALMGYMRIVNGDLIEEWGWKPGMNIFDARMSNTHPGPLPETEDTYGVNTSQKVIDLGLTASRHTVHVVAQGVDKGPIIAEHVVPVAPNDSADELFQRVQVIEKGVLPNVIDQFLKDQRAYHVNSRN